MSCEDFIFEFCILLSDILNSEQIPHSLSENDMKFVDQIDNIENIDACGLTVNSQISTDVLVYDLCTDYVQSSIAKNLVFEIGSGIEALDQYTKLLKQHCQAKTKKLPNICDNIIRLAKQRLKIIDFSSNQSQLQLQSEILSTRISKSEADVNQVRNNINVMGQTLDDISKTIGRLDEKRNDIYKDIIAIISIFAAIILTTSGVFSFSTSVLENINNANFYKLLVIVLILGMIFSSIFLGAYYFLYNVRHDIKTENPKTHKHRWLSPLIALDVVLAILIVLILIFKGNLFVSGVDFEKSIQESSEKVEGYFSADFHAIEGEVPASSCNFLNEATK